MRKVGFGRHLILGHGIASGASIFEGNHSFRRSRLFTPRSAILNHQEEFFQQMTQRLYRPFACILVVMTNFDSPSVFSFGSQVPSNTFQISLHGNHPNVVYLPPHRASEWLSPVFPLGFTRQNSQQPAESDQLRVFTGLPTMSQRPMSTSPGTFDRSDNSFRFGHDPRWIDARLVPSILIPRRIPVSKHVAEHEENSCASAIYYETEANNTSDLLRKRLALQRKKQAEEECAKYSTEIDAVIRKSELLEEQEVRSGWRAYGDIVIPWGLWREAATDVRSNGFLILPSSGDEPSLLKHLSSRNLITTTSNPGYAPNGVIVHCPTAAVSLNTSGNLLLSWQLRHGSWSRYAPPEKASPWEMILRDLCNNLVR